jgi:cysteine desulfurase family protein
MKKGNTCYNTYFDNGATSFPKPRAVAKEIAYYLNEGGGSYGRSFYQKAIETSRVVEDTRNMIAKLLNTQHPSHIIFTLNATYAINLVLGGINFKGKEIVVSPLEHNAVWRPLHSLISRENVKVKILPAFTDGRIIIDEIPSVISQKTDLVIINHQSNVNGIIQPIEEIKKKIGEIPLLVDCAQSIGEEKIEVDKTHIDYIAFTGHKSLLGPTGIGGLFIRNPESLYPLVKGGTGSNSESIDTPPFMPDRFEAGTPNVAGIYGLRAAMLNRPERCHSRNDFFYLVNSLKRISGLKILCANKSSHQGFLFSIKSKKMNCSDFGQILYEKRGIETRVGLHCAPQAHKILGTFPEGTLRISPSVYHRLDDFEYLIHSIKDIVKI